MDTVTLLAEARRAGLTVSAEGALLRIRGPKHAEALAVALLDHKPEVMALLAHDDTEVVWRVAAFCGTLPERGPIWPPKLRTTPQTDMPGQCSLCGDPLPKDPAPRFPRCPACVQAFWLALHQTREDT